MESRSRTNPWDGLKKPPGLETDSHILLSVSANDEDCLPLQRILNRDWTVIASTTVASALSLLRKAPIPIVICDCDPSLGSWIEMLDRISLLPDPPLFMVTSRLADERLWAEALNLGAFDVLAKPFDADEVIRVAGFAHLHWQDRHGVYFGRTEQRKSASGTAYLVATGT